MEARSEEKQQLVKFTSRKEQAPPLTPRLTLLEEPGDSLGEWMSYFQKLAVAGVRSAAARFLRTRPSMWSAPAIRS